MDQKLVDTVVNTVLYEGSTLYPYRVAAEKPRQQFKFGRVYPEAFSASENGAEPCSMQTQCLVEGKPSATLNITVRFLQPMERDIGALAAPVRTMPAPDNPDFFHVVPELQVDDTVYSSWQEAVERPVLMPVLTLSSMGEGSKKIPFSFPAYRSIEPIFDKGGHIAGVIVRRQEAVDGEVELEAQPIDSSTFKVTVRIVNKTRVPDEVLDDAEEIAMRTFVSTHTILHTPDAKFNSMINPPELYLETAAGCRNLGTWPVLVGNEEKETRDTMISSPIILDDYPAIEPADSGDPFDGGEIVEESTHRCRIATAEKKKGERRTRAELGRGAL